MQAGISLEHLTYSSGSQREVSEARLHVNPTFWMRQCVHAVCDDSDVAPWLPAVRGEISAAMGFTSVYKVVLQNLSREGVESTDLGMSMAEASTPDNAGTEEVR